MDFQKLIHQLEVGGGMRYFRRFALLLAVATVTLLYDAAGFKNMGTQEAMDAAQLGRNIAQGKGYTTYFIRPLSLSLVKERTLEKKGPAALGERRDDARLSGNHPDLANPPVYPVVLAGLMKVLPFRYDMNTARPFWSVNGHFWRYQPDFYITLFNQLLFFAVLVLVFLLARRLFDGRTACLATVLLFGAEVFWRFTVSGLSTLLVLLLFTGLLWGVVWLEEELREPKWGRTRLLMLAAGMGALVGVGALTRYSFGWLLLPVVAFLLLYAGRQRLVLTAVAVGAFLLVFAPWLVRNYEVSGTPFGTAGYAIVEGTGAFPGHQIERSLQPSFQRVVPIVRQKLMLNLRSLVQNDLPRLGGTWVTGFFLAGLLLSFPNPTTRRLRSFLLMCLGVLVFAQALGRTQLAEDLPEINSENLLVLLAPLVVVYGVSLFYLLLDQIDFRFRELRLAVVALFAALACLPMLLFLVPVALALLIHFQPPQSELPFSYPPYFPPAIQEAGRFSKPDGLIMSDMPWAVAWYGQAQSVWLTQRVAPTIRELRSPDQMTAAPEDFFSIHDYEKPIDALFLSRVTLDKLDSRSLAPAAFNGQQTWGTLYFYTMLSFPRDRSRPWPAPVNLPIFTSLAQTSGDTLSLAADKQVPSFPLRYWQQGGWPDFLLLTASQNPVRTVEQ
jgi:hypothetical protein